MLNRNITYRTMTGLATLFFIIILSFIYFNSNPPAPPVGGTNLSGQPLELLEQPPQAPKIFWKNQLQKEISLEVYKGQVVYINLWALWCEPCKEEIPFIAELASEFLTTPLKVLLVNVDEEDSAQKQAQLFIDEHGPQLESLYNQGPLFLNAFQVDILPTHVLIDKKGNIAMIYYGDILDKKEQFKLAIQQLLH